MNEDFTVCDVFSIRRSVQVHTDDPDHQTTYQDPAIGRYVLIHPNDANYIRVYDEKERYGVPVSKSEALLILKNVPETILEWLRDSNTKRHSNFIPAGYGWDGKFSVVEYKKRRRVQALFEPHGGETNIETDWLETTLDEVCRTTGTMVTTNWLEADGIPEDNVIRLKVAGNLHTYVFIQNNGDVIRNTNKYIGLNAGSKSISVPDNVIKVIELVHGVMINDNGTAYGIGVNLYSRGF